MAKRRRNSAQVAQLAFDALAIEGGLLSPEWLAKAAQLEAEGQGEADYRVPKGLTLRDEIGRFWRVAQAHWADFDKALAAGGDGYAAARRFVPALLQESFGFSSLVETAPVQAEGRDYSLGHRVLEGRAPVVVGDGTLRLDDADARFADGGRRRSAFGLCQEYLNAEDAALWGIASNGNALRLVRDNSSLTRPAWVEADLRRIFTEERYSDFAALWLLVHESRFGRQGDPVTACVLERWRDAGREQGTRARDQLRGGVEDALVALGQGFVAHPDNKALREALASGALTTTAFFQQLLRLAYRLIFLLTVEERGVLHPVDDSPEAQAARERYAEGYSLRRLRDRALKRSAHDRFFDVWEGVKVVLRGLASGEPRLALPALAGLFREAQCPDLDGAKLENRFFLQAMFRLSWLRADGALARVNWRDMGPEELGSVYESLLELVPQIADAGRRFGFATGDETRGNARKTTGSYYTPDSLVQVLLDSALEPVIARTIAEHPDDPVKALLELSIVDPACGSGHFLLAAARRLAGHVARLSAEGTPTAAEYRHALRQVVARCIYGVDLNPMAVELCKVSLWMEAVEPGLPLTFLESHIQQGNALLGTTPELMAGGIPDDAWKPIEGDDKKVASALKKRNKAAAEGQRGLDSLWTPSSGGAQEQVAKEVAALDAASDESLAQLVAKRTKWEEIRASEAYRHAKLTADAWCAAFVWPKEPGPLAEVAPTNELWRQLRDRQGTPPKLLLKTTAELAGQYQFFHWHLGFPQVFARGGFDVVVGNPPWDLLRFSEEEFFAERRPEIASAGTAAKRKKKIAALEKEDPDLFATYRAGLRKVAGENVFSRCSGRFPLCGVGRVNLFALFAETAPSLTGASGRVGQLLPSGIVFDDSTKAYFQGVVDQHRLVSFFDFENREGLFPAVHRSFKFGILTLAGAEAAAEAEFVFFATRIEHLGEDERRFALSAEEIALLNPTTRTCPIFRSKRDAELTKTIYLRAPVFTASGWKVNLQRLLNGSDDSGLFMESATAGCLPLYEGKYFHHFQHRWLTHDQGDDRAPSENELQDPGFRLTPRHWYPTADIRTRFESLWAKSWVAAWRDITNATNERTFIAAVLPSMAIVNTAKVILLGEEHVRFSTSLLANLSSFTFDFAARQKTGGTHMAGYIVEQLPLLSPTTYQEVAPWAPDQTLHDWIRPRVLELTYTAWDLEPFAKDVGYDGPPFRWDSARRFLLRAELDAAFFHLYGISRDDTDYILDTFPIVRRHDEREHGEYRTKRVILEIYDEMAEASRTGEPYQTRLDPPPADPRVAHPARKKALEPVA
jgi:hypothetical protein